MSNVLVPPVLCNFDSERSIKLSRHSAFINSVLSVERARRHRGLSEDYISPQTLSLCPYGTRQREENTTLFSSSSRLNQPHVYSVSAEDKLLLSDLLISQSNTLCMFSVGVMSTGRICCCSSQTHNIPETALSEPPGPPQIFWYQTSD